jgi:zinc transporter 1/2/3
MDPTNTPTAAADGPAAALARDSGFSVTVVCDTGNDFDGRIGLRISAIFVILVGSLVGTLLPILLARSARLRVPKLAFFLAKYFGSGVIIATAFIHLLAPAVEALGSPCLDPDSVIAQYSWPEGICLMTVFTMFFVELLASRYDILGTGRMASQGVKAYDPALDLIRASAKDVEDINGKHRMHHQKLLDGDRTFTYQPTLGSAVHNRVPSGGVSYPPGGPDHLYHAREHFDADSFATQMTALFILEFGVIFHSIFIGLTLAVSGDEFNVLYIVLVFHQSFEGLGLGSRLATALWPPSKGWLPYVLGFAYALSTPIAIAVGLGVRESLEPGSSTTLIINGVFDSISAGILVYTGLVELMAHEFLFSNEMRRGGIGMTLAAFGCMCLGAGLMALLGKWA